MFAYRGEGGDGAGMESRSISGSACDVSPNSVSASGEWYKVMKYGQ